MTTQVRKTALALNDIAEIGLFIAQDSLAAADRLLHQFDERFESLARMPLSAEAVPMFGVNVRRSSVGNYVIYYRPLNDDSGIEVLRVLHGARKHDDLV